MPTPDPPPNSVQCLTRGAWRAWLAANHASSTGVWLVTFKKASGKPAPTYDDVIEEALCFGWVDSRTGQLDADRTMTYLSPRQAKSGWVKPNKLRVEKLTAAGLMTPAGQAAVDRAKANGTWTLLDAVEAMVCPPDLAKALKANPTAKKHFDAFPPSVRKAIFQWVILAKRPDTRAKRIAETVALAAKNVRANQPRQPKG